MFYRKMRLLLAVTTAVVALATGSEVEPKVPGNFSEVDDLVAAFPDEPIPPLPGLLYPRESESREVNILNTNLSFV